MVHVGIGYDVHALVAGRKLILGGVEIPHTRGLAGHSDADALMHAICDAVLGALGEADIGHFFPNTDPRWKGAPSKIFLEEAAKQVAQRKGKIVNVDATIIAQAPKLYPHIAEMKKRIAAALGVSEKQIGVKATTNEKMGFIGREEGIAAMAVASVDLTGIIRPQMNTDAHGFEKHRKAERCVVFSLSSPKGGEGWGEEAVLISRPSPRPSPRSFLTGRGRIFLRHSVFDFIRVHLCPVNPW